LGGLYRITKGFLRISASKAKKWTKEQIKVDLPKDGYLGIEDIENIHILVKNVKKYLVQYIQGENFVPRSVIMRIEAKLLRFNVIVIYAEKYFQLQALLGDGKRD